VDGRDAAGKGVAGTDFHVMRSLSALLGHGLGMPRAL